MPSCSPNCVAPGSPTVRLLKRNEEEKMVCFRNEKEYASQQKHSLELISRVLAGPLKHYEW